MTVHRPVFRAVALLAAATLAVAGLPNAGAAATPGAACPGGYIALTYDDGPSETARQLLAALRAHGRGLCTGRIAHTPTDIPYGDQVFHAEAVRP
ncbi:MAG TPA: hypothetical protein VGB74_11815 [Actinoplanes sp.]